MNSYKVTCGSAVDYVYAANYGQAKLSAQQIFKTEDFSIQPATQEEVNSLMWSHSYPEQDDE